MLFHMLFIHLYRPFLKYTRNTSPLPAHVSPRKFLTQSAAAVSKLFRLYKRLYSLNAICNITVYFLHTSLTIHILNTGGVDEKNSKRDILHGLRHLEEIGNTWLCARRTILVVADLAQKWKVDLPDEAQAVILRVQKKWGKWEAAASPQAVYNSVPNFVTTAAATNSVVHAPLKAVTQANEPSARTAIPITQVSNGSFQPLGQTPDSTPDTRRSSGGMSLPPQSAAELSRLSSKYRSSARLTPAQQDAWNAYQASRLDAATTSAGESRAAQNSSPDVMFGGVDSLLTESQDGWLKDPSILAMDFGNWDPALDWGNLGFNAVDGNIAPGADLNAFNLPVDINYTNAGYDFPQSTAGPPGINSKIAANGASYVPTYGSSDAYYS
ncbi:MAG: hypothetical protein Q9227_004452 [Pyrenula ochraceoflavens]